MPHSFIGQKGGDVNGETDLHARSQCHLWAVLAPEASDLQKEEIKMNEYDVLEILKRKLRDGTLTRREFLQAAGMFGIGTLGAAYLAGCAPAPAATPVPPKPAEPTKPPAPAATATAAPALSGSLRFLVAESFWSDWHPYMTTAASLGRIGYNIWDRLILIESDSYSDFKPGLALEWKRLDQLTLEMKLRQGVKFHEGQDFTADDVKASIELASGATPIETLSRTTWVPTTVEIVDKYTVRLKTKTPFAPLLAMLSTTAIIRAGEDGDTLKKRPNGTGPFKLVKDEKDIKTMEGIPNYWLKGQPKLKTMVHEFVQDAQTRLNALLAGQADVIDRVPPEHWATIKANANLVLEMKTRLENVNMWMRQDAKPPFNNYKLRQAFAWCIDREAMVKNLLGGSSVVAKSFIPNLCNYFVEQQPVYTYNPDKALEAVKAAGFASIKDVPVVPISVTTGFLPRSVECVQYIIDNFQKVGFKTTLKTSDVAGMVDDLFSKADPKPGFMFHLSWGNGTGDPHSSLATLFRSPGAWAAPSDTKLDEMIDKGVQTVDPTERAKVYKDLQAYLWEQMPHIPLNNSDVATGYNKKVKGLILLGVGRQLFNNTSVD
jgi:peptide/nickel transport system substrate-binding protein